MSLVDDPIPPAQSSVARLCPTRHPSISAPALATTCPQMPSCPSIDRPYRAVVRGSSVSTFVAAPRPVASNPRAAEREPHVTLHRGPRARPGPVATVGRHRSGLRERGRPSPQLPIQPARAVAVPASPSRETRSGFGGFLDAHPPKKRPHDFRACARHGMQARERLVERDEIIAPARARLRASPGRPWSSDSRAWPLLRFCRHRAHRVVDQNAAHAWAATAR